MTKIRSNWALNFNFIYLFLRRQLFTRAKTKIPRCAECYSHTKSCAGNLVSDSVLFDFFCVIYDCYFSHSLYSKHDKIQLTFKKNRLIQKQIISKYCCNTFVNICIFHKITILFCVKITQKLLFWSRFTCFILVPF